MTKDIWINLPCKDVPKSTAFFKSIGFTLNTHYGNGEDSASFMIGDKNVVLMLFSETTFQNFTGNKISDTRTGSEVLFSISAESRTEVDELTEKAQIAGGTVFGKPSDIQGWMYGSGFTDLDGHRWNILYMDMSKMPS
jgi:uncharacterized protein